MDNCIIIIVVIIIIIIIIIVIIIFIIITIILFIISYLIDPDTDTQWNKVFRIGSTICIDIVNCSQFNITLLCPVAAESPENNVPPLVPVPTRLWTHTNLDGVTASLPLVSDGWVPFVTTNFTTAFPGIDNQLIVDTRPPANALIFSVQGVVRNPSNAAYRSLRQCFGLWTCTVSNSLGTESATTFFSDTCKRKKISCVI